MPPKRNYIQKSGRKVHGVTTQLGVMAKPALIWWGYKQGLYNYEQLSKMIGKILGKKLDDSVKVKEVLDAITNFEALGLYDKRDEAADAGTLAHEYVENYLRGIAEPDTDGLPQKVIDKAEGCFLTFLDWEKPQQLLVKASELPLVSEKLPVGGTIDHVIQTVTTKGKKGVELFDLKTGKDIYFEAKVQVGTYEMLWNEHHPDEPAMGCHILRLGPNGEFTHKFFPTLKPYFEIFEHLSAVFYRMKDLGERL